MSGPTSDEPEDLPSPADVLRALTECVLIADLAGSVQYANGAMLELLGCEASEVIAQPVHDILAKTVGSEGKALASTAAQVVIRNAQGEPNGFVFVVEHLALREPSHRHSEQNDLETFRSITFAKIARGVAHDLNSPLTAVLSLAKLCLQEVDADEPSPTMRRDLSEDLHKIVEAGDRCRVIVHDLLCFSRSHVGTFHQLSLQDAMRSAQGLLEYNLRRRRINMSVDMPTHSTAIIGDPSRLQQAFVHLILHVAFDLAAGSAVQVTATIESDACVLIRGVPAEGEGARSPDDNGLDWDVAAQIVDEHGGTLSGDRGRGVTLRLPVAAGSRSQATLARAS